MVEQHPNARRLKGHLHDLIDAAIELVNDNHNPENASVLIGDVISHVQTMRDMLKDPSYGFSTNDIARITAAIEQFESLFSGG